jgi:hypothetical protein
LRRGLISLATFGAILLLPGGGVAAAGADRPLKPPAVRTGRVLEVQGTYVILQGWVDPRGEVTSYYFQLGTTKSYGISPKLDDEQPNPGYRSESVYEAIPGLRPLTTYHFRLVADNRDGTTYGKDKTFKTHRSNG